MKNFYIDFSMLKEDGKVHQLIEELEDLEESFALSTEEGDYYPIIVEPIATIFIDSSGGENKMAAILYEFFKNSNYQYQFTVTGEFSSNAILILLALNPRYIKIMRQCMSTIHLSSYKMHVADIALNNPTHHSLNEYNDFKDYLNSMVDLYKMFLTKEELITIKEGKDVYLPPKRVVELFQRLKKDKKLQSKAKKLFEITL